MPAGFPNDDVDGGFTLRQDEAQWLKELWARNCSGSLLDHLATTPIEVEATRAPWDDPACSSVTGPAADSLANAQRYAYAIDGARLLFTLMVAEAYSKEFDGADDVLEPHLAELDKWRDEANKYSSIWDGWTDEQFWWSVRSRNANIDLRTVAFFRHWFDRLRHGDIDAVATDSGLRELVRERERTIKGSQAKLGNSRVLGTWRGGVATRTTFRWSQVREVVQDVRAGLGVDRARA